MVPSYSLLHIALKNLNSITNKIHFVTYFCLKYNIDIFSVTETWLCPSISNSVVDINGFILFRNDFISSTVKHGVCIYVKNTLKVYRYQEENSLPNTLAIYLPKYKLYILTVYRPPSTSPEENSLLIDYINRFCLGREVLLLGDFNLPSIHWDSAVCDVGVSTVDSLFLDLFNTLGLFQWVLEPTFIRSGNTLDLVLTSESDRVISLETHPPFPHCGHTLVKFDYLFQEDVHVEGICSESRQGIQLDWHRGNYSQIRSALRAIDWDFEFSFLGVEQVSNFITEILLGLVHQFVPSRKNRSSAEPPWFKKLSKALVRQKAMAWKVYKEQRTIFGRLSCQARQSLYDFNRLNNNLRITMLQLQVEYEEHLIEQRPVKPKLFHSYIRKKKVARPRVGPISCANSLTDDPSTMSEIFVDAFSSVFVVDDLPNPYPHQVSRGQMSDVGFGEADVGKLLSSLKVDSCMGPDGLHPYLLKECSGELSYPVSKLFRLSMDSATVPISWKHSIVSPIFKKGSHSDALNYRPISLTSVICKTMERIVTKQMFVFLEEHYILDDSQFGFRPNRSVVDQLLLTYNYVTFWYDQGNIVDLILFDFAKAFDRVDIEILLVKLSSIGIAGNLHGWIRSFLCGRQMKVCINGVSSSQRPVLSGVPQGSVLGPLLFLLFVNYIGSQLSCKYMIFADDLKLYFKFSRPASYLSMGLPEIQSDIDILFETASSWGLSFAAGKCVHLRFSRPLEHAVGDSLYSLGGTAIKRTPSHKDLGITVETNLKFHQHIKASVNKAGGVASNLLKSTVCRSADFMMVLLISDIRPLTDFSSQLWNLGYIGDLKQIESVQRRWTKQVSGLGELPYVDRLKKLKLFSVCGRLLRCDLIYCYKIFHGLSVITPSDLFILAPQVGTRGHRFKIQVQHATMEARKRFFSCRIIQPWNSLPSAIVDAPSLNVFKVRLHSFLGDRLFHFVG